MMMTNSQKFEYVMERVDKFIASNAEHPYTPLEKEAFCYEMLLLKGPAQAFDNIGFDFYRSLLVNWLLSLEFPCGLPDLIKMQALKKM